MHREEESSGTDGSSNSSVLTNASSDDMKTNESEDNAEVLKGGDRFDAAGRFFPCTTTGFAPFVRVCLFSIHPYVYKTKESLNYYHVTVFLNFIFLIRDDQSSGAEKSRSSEGSVRNFKPHSTEDRFL